MKLTDPGIGQVTSREALDGLTKMGFTQTMVSPGSSSHTGTQLYLAPELFAGKAASTRSDIYSLGVVLYQLLAGDFSHPVTMDWRRKVGDPLLREDLERCFAVNPEDRFGSAAELAQALRKLPERRAEAERRQAERRQAERRQAELAARERQAYRRGLMRMAGLAGGIVVVIVGLAVVAFNQSRRAKEAALAEKRERLHAQRLHYTANMNLAELAWERAVATERLRSGKRRLARNSLLSPGLGGRLVPSLYLRTARELPRATEMGPPQCGIRLADKSCSPFEGTRPLFLA